MNEASPDPAERVPPLDVNVRLSRPSLPRGRMLVIALVVVAALVVGTAGVFLVSTLQRDDLMRTGEQVQAVPLTDRFVSRTRNGHEYYYLVWSYTVDGREFTITGRDRHLSRASATSYIARLDGATATVYYDADDPSRAALGDEP